MLNKIRIVVFRGLKLRPEAHISMLLPSNRRIRTYLGRRGRINRLRASIRFSDRTAKQLRHVLGRPR